MSAILVAGLVAACGEAVEERHETLAAATAAGAVERGWIPSFVPASATDLQDRHDLDTNAQTLAFRAPADELERMIEGMPRATGLGSNEAEALLEDLGWLASGQPRELSTRAVCGDRQTGLLIIDSREGVAAYRTPVNWTESPCS